MKRSSLRPIRGAHILLLLSFGISCSDRELPTSGTPDVESAAPRAAGAAVAVEYVGAAWGAANNGSSLVLQTPAGTAAGDVMIAHLVVPGAIQVQAAAGWQLVRSDESPADASAFVFWRRAEAGESGAHEWRMSAASPTAGGIVSYRNVAADGNPIEAHAAQRTTNSTSVVAPSVSAAADGAGLVTLFSAIAERKEKSLTFTPPAGMTERYDESTSTPAASARNVAAMHASVTLANAGATGVRTARLSAARPAVGQTLVLRAGAAAPPPPPPGNRPPVANAGGPYQAAEGAAIQLDGSASSDPDGDSLTFGWTFSGGIAAGSGAKVTRAFPDNGTYQVVLTVTDAHGATTADTTTATIANVAPSVTLALSTAEAATGQTITATGTFTDPGAGDAPWSWELDWGDGTRQTGTASQTSTQISGTRAYAAANVYTVRLTVRDKDSGAGSAQASISITAPGQSNAWYTDFSEYPTNALPSGWSQPYSSTTWRVEQRTGATGGKVLYGATGTSSYYVLRWDVVGTPSDVELETVARVHSSSTYNESMALMARGQAGAATYYASRLDSGSGLWTLALYTNGVSSALATWPNPFPVGTWVRHRFRVEGTALKVKLWAAGAAEPTAWTMTATVGTPLGAGYAGIWMRRQNSANEFDWVKVTVLDSAPPTPELNVTWAWSGGQTASGATVRVQLPAPASAVRLRVSTDSLFSSYAQTATVSTADNQVATFPLSGLSPNTRYFYRAESAGAVNTSRQGAFRTLVAPNTPFSFTFALGSCQSTDTNSGVFNHIRAANPLFWLQTGDIHYRDLTATTIDAYRSAYNALHQQPNQAALYRSAAIVHVWDDHDGAGGNDTDGTRPGWPAARAAYRESLPHHPLPAGPGGAIYHSFVVGRVRFIVSDLRSERSPKTAVDDVNKTMFGAAQKQHFKDQLALAKANGEFIVWVSTLPWIGARETNADYWAGYDTERQEIASYIGSLGVGNRMFVLTGDMHASAIDTGANNAWGGFPVFNAGPLDRAANVKGGPYSWGPLWTNEQFGVVTVTDDGGSTITVRFSARNNAAELTSHQFTLSLQSAVN